MKSLNKIFCRHIWEGIGKKFLGDAKEELFFNYSLGGFYHYVAMKKYAIKEKCIKCDDTRWKKKWIRV